LEGRTWKTNNLLRTIVIDAYQGTTHVLTNIKVESTATGTVSSPTLTVPAGTITFLIKPDGFLNTLQTINVTNGGTNNFPIATQIKAGDLIHDGNGTGKNNALDYNELLKQFNKTTSATTPKVTTADLDGSGQVNSLDFSLMLSNWGKCDINQTGRAIEADCAN